MPTSRPRSARALGGRYREQFAAFAAETPLPQVGGPLTDGRRFARWLAERGKLPEEGRLQAMAIDLHYTLTPQGLVRCRRPALRFAWLSDSRRLVVALRVPGLGERWFRLSLGRASAGHRDEA